MRLLSLTVRNYRVHRGISVDFDPGRHLIGGPNEAGKSTLVEAIHRVLFMRHRAGGDLQKSMVSDVHSGVPEVMLRFESGKEIWTVEKHFAGARGTVKLRSDGGLSLQGDAAEDQLAALTGNPEGVANRLNELSSRWAHLWVWQGCSGNDPSPQAAGLRDSLVQRLQEQGLAAVMQSDRDERVRETIRLAHEEIFTRTGAVRANSRLDLATRNFDEATAALERATTLQQRLEAAALDQQEATAIIERSSSALPAERAKLEDVSAALTRASALAARSENEQLVLNQASREREAIESADRKIRSLLRDAQAAKEALVPSEAKLGLLAEQESAAREAAEASTLAHRASYDALRLAQKHHDFAAATISRFEKAAAYDALTAKAGEITTIRDSLTQDREALSKLPAISPASLDALRKLETQLDKAQSALSSIAAGIELVSSDLPVLLDGEPLEPGKSRIITENASLTLGTGTRLRIQPGGGVSLADSLRTVEQLEQKLSAALESLAVRDSTEAAGILTRRQTLEQKISHIEARLQALGAPGLAQALADAKAGQSAADAELDRRREALAAQPLPPPPATLADARLLHAETHEALRQADAREKACLAEADARQDTLQTRKRDLQALKESLEAARKQLEQLETSARLLEQQHGDAATRHAALEAARLAEDRARAALESTTQTLAELNPDSLNRELQRLNRVIAQEQEKQRDAEKRRAGAQALLAQDGTTDPAADLLQARAQHAAAAETLSREQRHADAMALLHRLFSECQTAISQGLTQPIADRVAAYLECIFGRGVRVCVDLSDLNKPSIDLTRPGTPSFAFSSLSGGTREQVASAFRLAMAEILAANHGGCLPLVFDDAFAHSDPARIQVLQSMLDLAANRGLQIIVLTCNPADYIGLGATETQLPPAASQTA